ncbi:MAG: ABC transporter permease [Bacilli bacterium]
MREMTLLVYNEFEKIYRKKRLFVIIAILVILIPLFVYGQMKQSQTTIEKIGTDDWRIALQQQIIDTQNRIGAAGISPEFQKFLKIRMEQQQYYLDNNINPMEPGAPTFAREFIQQSTSFFLPLLIMIIAIDIISGERADGTIKVLLTRPVKRWKIFLSKYLTVLLFSGIIVFLVAILSYLLSGLVFGYAGWTMPVLSGFSINENGLDTSNVSLIPQWQYVLWAAGLAWFVTLTTGTISFMLSVLIRNTPAAMGAMVASLIAGGILQGFASSWEGAKYIFSVNLQLTDFLSGQIPPFEGLTLAFSILCLSGWSLLAFLTSFYVFTKQDMVA